MPKHLITVASIALSVVALAGCGSHHSSPLTPPTSTTSVPVFGGGQIPDVIDVPTTTPSATKAR
ncbi:hypothetical protein ACQP1O_09085 [Nocardia sp. CA-151230]|uniref:hypothetical protein n=1 Tax=Nocardia sp. CA-151230 TaxID=3239982 RepID=UPI003D91B0E7